MSRKPERSVPANLVEIPAKPRLDGPGKTLQAALDLMNGGRNWTAGTRRRERPDGSLVVCALGAIDEVTRGPFRLPRRLRARRRLADSITSPTRNGTREQRIAAWNDDSGGWYPEHDYRRDRFAKVNRGFETAIAKSQRGRRR